LVFSLNAAIGNFIPAVPRLTRSRPASPSPTKSSHAQSGPEKAERPLERTLYQKGLLRTEHFLKKRMRPRTLVALLVGILEMALYGVAQAPTILF